MATQRARRPRRLSAEHLELRRLLAVDVQQVANINATDPFGAITDSAEIGGKIYFVAHEPGKTQTSLWITDGTAAGLQKQIGRAHV